MNTTTALVITRVSRSADGIECIRWEITEGGEFVGLLDAHPSGLILNVDVAPSRQREGHASALYEHATAEMELLHAPVWGRTPEGNAFAEAVGGDTMDDDEAAEILDLVWDEACEVYFAA